MFEKLCCIFLTFWVSKVAPTRDGFSSRSSNFYDVYANSTLNYSYDNVTSHDYSNFNGVELPPSQEYEYAKGEWIWVPEGGVPTGFCKCDQNAAKNDPFASFFGSNAQDRQGILGLITPGTAQMLASAVAGIASSGVAYADLSGQITQIKAEVSALSSAQTSLTSTVSTLSTSSTCIISKVKELTTVSRTAITGTTSYSDLTVTSAATTIPDFTTTTDKNTGESLILMNRNFIKSMEDIADPSCS